MEQGARTHSRLIGRPLVPKEHGAWAILYGSFLAGVGVAGRVTIPVALLLLGVSALALAYGALRQLSRPSAGKGVTERRCHARTWLLASGLAAAGALSPLLFLWRLHFLIGFGVAAAAFLLLRLVRRGDDRSLAGELAGAAGLTLMGPVAHAVAVQAIHPAGLALWPVLFLFFASGVFYVRMRIQGLVAERRRDPAASRSARVSCILYHLLLIALAPILAALHVLPWPALLAYIPPLWRAARGLGARESRLDLRRLGWSETALAASFVLLLIGAFWLSAPLG